MKSVRRFTASLHGDGPCGFSRRIADAAAPFPKNSFRGAERWSKQASDWALGNRVERCRLFGVYTIAWDFEFVPVLVLDSAYTDSKLSFI